MLMTIEELRGFLGSDIAVTDLVLAGRLSALELTIRRATNNTFQSRAFRIEADIRGGVFMSESLIPFEEGDTIMVSRSDLQSDCIAVVKEVTNDTTFTTDGEWADDNNIIVTKVVYPIDVKMAAADIIGWQLGNKAANSGDASKKNIQSETMSRYSVTYAADTTETDIDASFGVPKKLTAPLKAYCKARF